MEPVSDAVEEAESDKVLLSDVPQLVSKILKEVTSLRGVSPLSKAEEEKVKAILEVRKDFIFRGVHYAQGRLLLRGSRARASQRLSLESNNY